MRKTGKYECKTKGIFANMKAPKTPADAKKEMRNVLLQTYFTSLVSLVLCISLFLGTSYAWFTSEVTQSNNQIFVGSLEVGLSKLVDGQWLSMKGDGAPKLFNDTTVWNPGYTKMETIKIENTGNLDFKYVMGFADGSLGTTANEKRTVDTVAQQFDVWHRRYNADNPTPASYADVNENNGWTYVGTVREILANEKALVTADLESGQTAAHTYDIAVHMSEGACPELMGARLSLSVKLVAYQKVGGAGSITPVANAADLKAAAASTDKNNIILTNDISIMSVDERIVMNGGVLDGAKKTIAYSGGRVDGASVGVVTTNGGVVSNLLIDAGSNGRALYVTDLASDLAVTGCTFSGTYSFNINSANKTNKVVRFTSCILNNWTSYANIASRVDFVGCTFNDVLKPYGDTVLTGCIFEGSEEKKGLDVTELEVGETITLVNCTYKGKPIENAVVTAVAIEGGGKTIKITGSSASLLTVNTQNSTYPLKLAN